ncbi:uncharacterized protein TRIVIDRAFT_187778 [Trichoderma virens Gv29-8]|uniref:Endonuclease/exonuclease/phosphatase domain-containing protein n=1 Tax=Hypocrea virens (strain Gv29-8 / FGSC 10586) TaxID=413071 RepID=G9MFK7_HYPVG|nr:uncharacterized protein TRIVIDRAFT_187778 [Trichoderma virens Gv29-8]EHK26758.1 hypothetical protein TRIVIDRAFT_187778 [Trichoderma virens Gv29-8]
MTVPRISRLLSSFRPSTRCWAPIPLRLPTVYNVGQYRLLQTDASDVIFLQEVNYDAYAHLLRDTRIRDGYFITDAEDKTAFDDVPFTTITLLSKASFTCRNTPGNKLVGPVTRHKFPSHYGREALSTEVFLPLSSCDDGWRCLRLINVHLDSLSSTLHYRKEQMAIVASILHEDIYQTEEGQGGLGLAAGDFNAISPEDQELIAKNKLTDAWVQLHGDNIARYGGSTWGNAKDKRWDRQRPGRLDRVAMTGGLETLKMDILRPGTITLPKPGKENDEISWSDHAGLRCTFRICY